MSDVRELLDQAVVMPVIVIERREDAVPLARALVAGGIRVLEVTLRTPAALDAVRAIAAEVPEAVVGVGTLLNAAQVADVCAAGARFAVSPGWSASVADAVRDQGLPWLPGVMTPSDVMTTNDKGFRALKLFPAEQAGGIAMLRALAGPFPDIVFCPTGGITAATAGAYLALANVACVGGSWLTPAAKVAAGDWSGITELARAAVALQP